LLLGNAGLFGGVFRRQNIVAVRGQCFALTRLPVTASISNITTTPPDERALFGDLLVDGFV
jgi:hypothetical protein